MYKSLMLTCAIGALSMSAQANSWLDVATAVLNAKNGNAAAEAESNLDRSRAQANAAIALANAHALANQNQIPAVNNVAPVVNAATSNNGIYTTSYLKTLDCTDLTVEARSFERTIDAAYKQTNAANTATPVNSIAKFAGIASGALSAFGGQSESLSRVTEITSALAGNPAQPQAAGNVITQTAYDNAVTNLENIRIYQKAKQCI